MKFRRISSMSMLCACLLFFFFSYSGKIHSQINTFPYLQTFGSGTCSLPTGYSNSGSDPWDIQDTNETYMDGLDHTTGGGCFASMDDSGGSADDSCLLTTPSIDLTSVPNAKLKFWWQNSNSTTSAADNLGPRPWSNMYIDISIDSGATWIRNVWSVQDSQQIGWAQARIALDSFITTKTMIRFRGLETRSFRSDLSLDDIEIYQPFDHDAALSAILSPTGKSCADSATQIKVRISNEGADTITSLTVYYKVDSMTTVSESISVLILPSANYVHTFTQTANIVNSGSHSISTWLTLTADSVSSNDSLTSTFIIAPTVNNFPYFENFESGQNGWEISGVNSSWAFGYPSKNIISGTTSGNKVFVNGGLTGTYSDNENSRVSSPCFDFSNVSSQLAIGMDIWWETEVSYDGAVVQYSSNGGSTWNTIGAYQDPLNWYNDNSINAAPGGSQEGWSGTGSNGSGMWLYAKHELPLSISGTSGILFRVAFASDGSVVGDGIAFDNVSIFKPAQWDARVGGVISPSDKICANSAQEVKIAVFNGGTDTISILPVSFQVDSGAISSDTIFATILPNAVYIHTLVPTANMSVAGTSTFKAWTRLAGDSAFGNDTFSTNINIIPTISSYPYFEDFESGKQDWVESGINSSWAFGTPSKTIINSASSGNNAFVNGGLTGTYNTSEISEVRSPCFDFSSTSSQYYVASDIWWETVSISDGVTLQYTTDNGSTWITIGATGDPYNWYNYNFITANPGGQPDGWTGTGIDGSGSWVDAKHILPLSLINSGPVQFRFAFASLNTTSAEGFAFDDFEIYKPNPWDASVRTLLSPKTVSCGDSMATVSVQIYNEGSDTIRVLPVSFQLNGGSVMTDTVNTVIAPSSSVSYSFTQMINVAAVGNYTLKTWTNLAFDSIPENDTLISTLITSPNISSYPYYEDFENGQQGWEISGVNSTWVLGNPSKLTIQGASSGSNAFVNGGLTGSYNNYEVSNVNSPCFDLPVTNNDLWLAIDIWYEIEFTWDGAVLQYSSDSGNTWVNLGAYNDPYFWYNQDTIYARPGNQPTGWSGNNGSGTNGWKKAKHILPTSLHGKQDVVFRVAFASDNIIKEDGMAFDNFAIVEFSKVEIDSHQTVSCDTNSILVTASSTSWGRYKWNNNVKNDSIYINSSGRYWVKFTDSILDLSSYDTTYLSFFTPPNIQLAPYLDSIIISDSLVLDASATGNVSYMWTPGNDTTSSIMLRGIDLGVGVFDYVLNVVDSNSCEDVDTARVIVFQDTATGIVEIGDDAFNLYPNPAKDRFTVETNQLDFRVDVMNSLGQIVLKEWSFAKRHDLDVSTLNKGVYYVRIHSEEQILIIKKMVKE